jgi:hypothetical protein
VVAPAHMVRRTQGKNWSTVHTRDRGTNLRIPTADRVVARGPLIQMPAPARQHHRISTHPLLDWSRGATLAGNFRCQPKVGDVGWSVKL